jgi:hypothetical protein
MGAPPAMIGRNIGVIIPPDRPTELQTRHSFSRGERCTLETTTHREGRTTRRGAAERLPIWGRLRRGRRRV